MEIRCSLMCRSLSFSFNFLFSSRQAFEYFLFGGMRIRTVLILCFCFKTVRFNTIKLPLFQYGAVECYYVTFVCVSLNDKTVEFH